MIICKGESGTIYTFKDLAMDIRDYAYTNTTDTLVFSTDYFISNDFSAEGIIVVAQQLFTNKIICEKTLNLNERNIWKSDSLIIIPSNTRIVNLKTKQIEVRPTKGTSNKVLLETKLNNAKTFNDMKGYALFRNMKIEPLHKHHNNDREE